MIINTVMKQWLASGNPIIKVKIQISKKLAILALQMDTCSILKAYLIS
jgi:hypothetical protein